MTDYIRMNFQALAAGSEGLSAEETRLLERLADLDAALRAVAAGWDGAAKNAFDINIQAFRENTMALAGLLGRTGNQVALAGERFQNLDSRMANMLHDLT
ncbi:WXG100 family type VII secretion target [Streptomyces sp. RFCAC02]|uniref:WXG100 family type VII secretion target n=1 Tax=Streptomyces sp. RFCAC02 TaxID=2499143 RepID=UPI0010201FF6|nr:WXG100 family type VII secretion target [Streptomyces sp. RFCAC02]